MSNGQFVSARIVWIAVILVACSWLAPAITSAQAPGEEPSILPQAPAARALIIAIANYGEPPTGMKNERGQDVMSYRTLNADNDVAPVRDALHAHGFRPENVSELRDEQATRSGILGAFEALIERSGAGDAVVIHYSGHGHQITDDHGPQDELDGYDELLVPYGAPAEMAEGYRGEYHIRDDTVGYYVRQLRERVGPTGNVTVFLDACYSGTGTRGDDELPTRGAERPLGAPHPSATSQKGDESTGFETGRVAGTRGGDDGLAPFVVISAASHDEVAWETYGPDGQAMGSLSYAMMQSLPRLRPGDTYNTLFTYINSALDGKVRQTPQMEGDREVQVFRAEFVRARTPSVKVAEVLDERRVRLDAGGLVGLNPGSFVSLYPPSGLIDEIEPWAGGAVVEASTRRAILELDGSVPPGVNLLEARAVPERLAYGEQAVRVLLAPDMPRALADSVRDRLGDIGMVHLVEDAGEVIVGVDVVEGHLPADKRSAERRDYWNTVAAATVNESAPLTPPAASAWQLAQRVEDWARNQYLRRLQLEHPEIDVDFDLAVVDWDELAGACSNPDWATATEHSGYLGGGRWELAAGTDYVLRVRNNSSRALHFAVIDLMPPGATLDLVKPLYPDLDESAAATELPPGAALQIPSTCFVTDPTAGIETLKLFVSTEPVPVDRLVGMRSRSSQRGGDVPMTATRELHLRVLGPEPAGTPQ